MTANHPVAARPRIALVFPAHIQPDSFFGYVLPSTGIERLAAMVEDIADVELFDARFEPDLVARIAAMRPDIIGVNVKSTMHCRTCYAVADRLRAAVPTARVVLGGLHVTACPEEGLDHADYVVCGEGEVPFRQLVEGHDPTDIRGLAFHGPDGKVVNPRSAPMHDLDSLPPPARHLRKPHYRYAAAGLVPMDIIETSRGCTHACSFCSPGSVYPHRWRAFSAEYVLAEIQRLADAGVKLCMLADDHFGGDFDRIERICDGILARGIRMGFFCFIRAFTGRTDLKRKMVEAGFVLVTYGAESPSKEQLRRYNKGYPTASEAFLHQVNQEWREAGARYIGNSYVFGDVADSVETLEALGGFARRLDPTYIEPLYAQPYPATKYREELVAAGLVTDRDWSDYTETRLLVKHAELDEERARRLRARVWVDFFSPRKATSGTLMFPLYLYEHLGVDRATVLKYMQAVQYSLFGCFLEDKPYKDLHAEMVEDYFRRAVATYEPEELEMTDQLDPFARMLGLGPLMKLAGTRELVLAVVEGPKTLASAVFAFEGGRLVRAHVVPGALAPAPETRRWTVPVPLGLLARMLAAPDDARRVPWLAAIAANATLGDLPRRLVGPRLRPRQAH